MKLREIIRCLETFAPPSLQEGYDNSGLLVGKEDADIAGALVCLDITEAMLDEAREKNCNLIVAHHPIIFGGLKRLTGKDHVERTVIKAIKEDIALYALHTNLDNVAHGVNAEIGRRLGISSMRILSPKSRQLTKLTIYVPEDHVDQVAEAMFEAGAGSIGNYDQCSFRTKGVGTFRPNGQANPFVGTLNQREHVEEQRLEMIAENYKISAILKAARAAHPYEEIAYDQTILENTLSEIGSGMVGELQSPMDLNEFLHKVKTVFGCGVVKHTKSLERKICKVAWCGGSGFFLLKDAIRSGADIFLTADIKYHDFFEADNKIVLADMGHFESEQFTIELIAQQIQEKFPTFAVRKTGLNSNPVYYYI